MGHDAFGSPRALTADALASERESYVSRTEESVMQTETVIVEIRAAEGGADAKLLVEEQLAIYVRLGGRRSL